MCQTYCISGKNQRLVAIQQFLRNESPNDSFIDPEEAVVVAQHMKKKLMTVKESMKLGVGPHYLGQAISWLLKIHSSQVEEN